VTSTDLSLRRLRAFRTASAFTLFAIAAGASAQESPPLDYYVGNAGVGLPVAPSARAGWGEVAGHKMAANTASLATPFHNRLQGLGAVCEWHH